MTFSLAILDEGITNATQARLGKQTVFEFDFLKGDTDTDNGIARTHANRVFEAALNVSHSIDILDLKIGDEDKAINRLVQAGLQELIANGSTL